MIKGKNLTVVICLLLAIVLCVGFASFVSSNSEIEVDVNLPTGYKALGDTWQFKVAPYVEQDFVLKGLDFKISGDDTVYNQITIKHDGDLAVTPKILYYRKDNGEEVTAFDFNDYSAENSWTSAEYRTITFLDDYVVSSSCYLSFVSNATKVE